jgi:hypothetical protein
VVRKDGVMSRDSKDIVVHTFDMKRIDTLIKESDKELQQYIKSLKQVSDGWERLFHDAISKIRRMSKLRMYLNT